MVAVELNDAVPCQRLESLMELGSHPRFAISVGKSVDSHWGQIERVRRRLYRLATIVLD